MGAYRLMLAVRGAIPKSRPKSRDLAKAEFATLRLRLIKIARARHGDRTHHAPGLRRLPS